MNIGTNIIQLMISQLLYFSESLCSFLYRGTNQNFSIPNSDLATILQGDIDVSFNFVIKPNSSVNTFQLWSNGNIDRGVFITYYNSTNEFTIYFYDTSGGQRYAKYPLSAINLNAWNSITITLNNILGRSKMYVNGSEITRTSKNYLSNTPSITNNDDFHLGGNNVAGFGYYYGYLNQSSIVLGESTLGEHLSWFNNGDIKDPKKIWGNRCKMSLNPYYSGNTAQFSMFDSINNITATSQNMIDSDKNCEINPYNPEVGIGKFIIGSTFKIK
jgi:hypothetical protein